MKANICGTKVRQLRNKHKMEQVDVSAALELNRDIHISQSDISEIELHKRGVKDYELKALAEIFEVSVDSLLEDASTD